jgi:putative SOS response-associated peptidase YedK
MKWGLIPSFTKPTDKPDYYKIFNARSESIHEKPSFRRLIPTRRCLVITEGFYEWHKNNNNNYKPATTKSKKHPYFITFSKDKKTPSELMVFAGLYDTWKDGEGNVQYTVTILTTEASKRLQWLHDRMPVILRTKEKQDWWLYSKTSSDNNNNKSSNNNDGTTTTTATSNSKLLSLSKLGPYDGDDLTWWPVTPAMGRVDYQSEEASKPMERPSVKDFFKPRMTPSKRKKREEEEEEEGGGGKGAVMTKEKEEEKEGGVHVGSAVKVEAVNTDEQPLKMLK